MKKLCLILFLLSLSVYPLFADTLDHFYHFDNDWALRVDLTKFKIQENRYNYEKSMRKIYATSDDGFGLSVFIEPAAGEGDAKKARAYYTGKLKFSPLKRSHEKTSERGTFAMYEYMIEKYENMEINQKHTNVYAVLDNLWLDVHISKTNYSDADKQEFMNLVNAIKIEKKTPRDYFDAGAFMYEGKNYAKAAEYFGKSLELEKKKRSFQGEYWYALIDLLGMSLVMSGDMKAAKDIFAYGVKTSPEYPMFSYNLACSYAEEGDKANAIKYLKNAVALSKSSGTKIPDASADSSFRSLKDSPEFKAVFNE